jgi:transcriptional regulator with XRE-family HTH domain
MLDCKNSKKIFGEILRKQRLSKGLTQEKLAYESDLTVYTIGQVELGKVSPNLTTICKIAKALKISISELTKGM